MRIEFKAKTLQIRNWLFTTQAEADLADALWNIQEAPMAINEFQRLFKFVLRMAKVESEWAN